MLTDNAGVTHLEQVCEHQAAGNFDRVHLEGGATVSHASITWSGRDTDGDRLSGPQKLVVHLKTHQDILVRNSENLILVFRGCILD